MIRVLQSVSNMDRAGIETMLMNYYRNTDRTKIQYDFLCNKNEKGAYDDEIIKLGGKVYYSPGFNPFKIFQYINFLRKIKEENEDMNIIHSHNAALSSYTLLCAKLAGFNIRIAHSHSTKTPSSKKIKLLDIKWIYKTLLKNFVTLFSVKNIACGEEAGNFLFGKKKFEVIRNCIDIKKFEYSVNNRNKIRKKYGISNNEIVIGHVGRYNVVKNHKFIIEMFSKLLEKKDSFKLILIGDGELKEKIILYARELSVDDKIIFVDSIPNVNEFYSAMDIFILPSKFEGIPVVGIEAQAAGLKCLFSNRISKESKITDSTSFLEIKSNCVSDWVESINSFIIEDRAINIDVFKEYDIIQNANKLNSIYMELLKNNEGE